MAIKRTFVWIQCGILLVLYPSFSVAQTACTSHFTCTPQAYGTGKFIDLKGIVVAEDASIGDQMFVCQWDDPAATAAPPSGELFDKYFAVESTETSKWTCTVKSPLTGVPDYPDVNSTIKANTIFTGFSDFDSCTFEVTIAVTDVNSQTPEFNQASYSVDISEDTQVDALVATGITIRDQDKDEPNNVVVLSVDDNCPVSPDPSEYKDFGGNFKDANFKLRTRVDYEETKSYDCNLTLKDKGISELFTTADLKVMVKDIPDQDPVFDEIFYTAEVTDPVPEEGGTILETQPKPIHAVDGDTGDPSLITYSMEVLDPAGLGTTYFVIDSTTGVLTHVAPLEDEVLEKKRFIIRLTATDESKAKGNSILEIDLPPVPTTTPEPTTSTTVVTTTTPEPTTTSTTVLTETTTTPPSSTHESSSSSSETPSTTASSVTKSTTTPSETTASGVTESTTTPSVTESTSSSSMTQSTTTSVMTESTTSPSMTYSTSSSSMSVSTTSPIVTDVTSSSVTQSTTSPLVTDSTTSSSKTESTIGSTLSSSTITGSIATTSLTSLTASSSVTKSTTELATTSLMTDSTTSPNTTYLTTTSVVTEPTTSPSVTKSSSSSIVIESTTSPIVTKSTSSSSMAISTTSSIMTESTTSSSITESTTPSTSVTTTSPSVTESTSSSSMTQSTTSSSMTESTTSSNVIESTTSPSETESVTSTGVTELPTSSSMTETKTSINVTESTISSSVPKSTTTPSVTGVITSSSTTESTTSSVTTESTTSTVMTESTTDWKTSPTTTPGPEMSLHFTKDAYAGDVPERYAAAFLKVDVIVKGFDRSDVIFSLEDSDSAYFDINSPDGEIRLKTGAEAPPPGEYSFTARAKGPEETKLESTAKVNVVVLTASPENLSLTQSLYWTKLMENKTQERFFEIKVDDTAVDPVSYCIINVKPTKYNESFQVVEDAGKWYLEMKGEPIDYEKTQEVSLIIQVFDKEGPCEDKTVQSLSRNEAMVLISIINLNDEDPFFQIPSSGAETVFYPKDVALQKIVGPVTTLQADDGDLKDSSLGEKISYSITNEVAGFSIEKDTGAIYVKSEFSCEGEGCQIKVKALDAVNHATEEVTIVVKSLDMGSIFTLALNDTEVGQVDGKLRTLSDEVGLQISKVYVNSEVEVSTEVQQRYPGFSPHRSRRQFGQPTEYLSSGSSSNAEEHWQIEVNVYAMDEAGNLVTLEEFNKKLSESDHNEAVPFVDEEIFNPPAAGDDTGLIAAVSVLAVLLGIILLAGGGFLVYRKHRARTTNKPKDISTVGGAYPNHSYSDDESETKSATSKRSDVIVLNGSLGRTDDVDTFGELNNESKIGLRRTDPGTPEFYGISSREPPPSYNKEERPTSKPLVGSLSKDTGPSLYPSLTSDGPVEPQTTTTYLTKSPKKVPPPLNSAPAKSILRGKSGSDTRQDIPLYNTSFQQKDTSKPPEPAADYKEDENDDAPVTSAFASLKGSPKLKKKSVPEGDHLKPEDDDSDEDGDSHSGKVSFKREVREIGGPEEKKSNLKQDNEREDEEEKSVAFKVLVDMKVVETENAGPSQKAAAVAAAKSDALEILEANRKKMKESAGAGEEKEEDGDDDMLQSSL